MNINLKTVILYFLIGIGFGGIIYSLALLANGAVTQTVGHIVTVVLVSGCMGLVSLIFELEKPAFIWRLSFLFLLIYSLFLFLNWQVNTEVHLFSPYTLLQFIVIYLLVWLVVVYLTQQKVAKINEKLRERKESLDKGH